MMHFTFSDVRENEKLLGFDFSASFNPKVLTKQTKWDKKSITVHYKLVLMLINQTLNEACKQLKEQHPDLPINRETLSIYDAMELYEKTKIIVIDGGNGPLNNLKL